MPKKESLTEFYQHHFPTPPAAQPPDLGQTNVFRLEDVLAPAGKLVPYSRRDFYKITLVRGRYAFHYADKSLDINGPTLLFFNPAVPYTWQPLSDDTTGFFCIFRETFFSGRFTPDPTELPMFRPGGQSAYPLNAVQYGEVGAMFEKMLAEINSAYPFKYELLRNYVAELIHYALKLQPSHTYYQHPDAKVRLTAVFTELLERQFPIESPAQRFSVRSAGEFARQLSVHVNHLNRSVRETTGKTTTDHIAHRVASEARALLLHTDWNIAEIGYSLGFDEPAHFSYFFKKHAGLSPLAFRRV